MYAQFYEKTRYNEKTSDEEAIHRLNLRGNEKVLDLGCGPGTNTLELAKLVPNGSAVGIDLSKEMIERAIQISKKLNINNVEFINMSATDIGYNNEFDVVFAAGLLCLIADVKHQLILIYNALKKGGQLMLKVHLKESNGDYAAINLMKLTYKKVYRPFFKNFTIPIFYRPKEFYTDLLKEVGFKNINENFFTIRKFFKNSDINDQVTYYRGAVLPFFIDYLPDDKKQNFITDFEMVVRSDPDPLKLEFQKAIISCIK